MNTKEIMNLALNIVGFQSIPYDSEIYVEGENIKTALFGIDIGAPELLLAKQRNYDVVISHHPQGGRARIEGYKVFSKHVEQMVEAGIPLDVAKKAVQTKMASLEIQYHSINYGGVTEIAKLLNIPFMNIHNPLDEIGRRAMNNVIQDRINNKKDALVEDVVNALQTLPEFNNALTEIKIPLGLRVNIAGKVVVSHAAYTNGGYQIAHEYFKHGIGTIIYIHIADADLIKLKQEGVGNIILTGHIASDSVGINPFIGELEKRGISVTKIGIVPPKLKDI